MREGNIIKRTFAAMLACVIVFTGGIGITARRALAYNAGSRRSLTACIQTAWEEPRILRASTTGAQGLPTAPLRASRLHTAFSIQVNSLILR